MSVQWLPAHVGVSAVATSICWCQYSGCQHMLVSVQWLLAHVDVSAVAASTCPSWPLTAFAYHCLCLCPSLLMVMVTILLLVVSRPFFAQAASALTCDLANLPDHHLTTKWTTDSSTHFVLNPSEKRVQVHYALVLRYGLQCEDTYHRLVTVQHQQ